MCKRGSSSISIRSENHDQYQDRKRTRSEAGDTLRRSIYKHATRQGETDAGLVRNGAGVDGERVEDGLTRIPFPSLCRKAISH
ncbi:hypothetical protein EVAR_19812_1 [Eumeta japonica]|uniref:Uncharacterized protein n=1 Tax=Eumeta variegata TaxID=151549 RepID=A0A4C1URD1_EUMVA|nr:hypothetical protein EVAR_19812_1 [Eumeta japonica]